jgi:hypothetical protein
VHFNWPDSGLNSIPDPQLGQANCSIFFSSGMLTGSLKRCGFLVDLILGCDLGECQHFQFGASLRQSPTLLEAFIAGAHTLQQVNTGLVRETRRLCHTAVETDHNPVSPGSACFRVAL